LYAFYNALGFEQISDEYLEDGIAHILMLLRC
jgi:predicted GNAT family N-acyltransferase